MEERAEHHPPPLAAATPPPQPATPQEARAAPPPLPRPATLDLSAPASCRVMADGSSSVTENFAAVKVAVRDSRRGCPSASAAVGSAPPPWNSTRVTGTVAGESIAFARTAYSLDRRGGGVNASLHERIILVFFLIIKNSRAKCSIIKIKIKQKQKQKRNFTAPRMK